ncbi:hypothetical protein A2W24_04440 [Microgenomates group bacterium RBG_16_45_19]|nr:MAG: hypothetical protein A2W24_04440 [Microgenomates group bacterium RBG_16_45_19]
MKILIVNKFFYPRGGPETVMFQQMKHLQSLGHEVIPFAMQDERNLETEYSRHFVSNVDYHQINGSPVKNARIALKMIYSAEAKQKIERLLDETKPNIAHLHNIYHQISPSILGALNRRKIPVVMTLHDFKLLCPSYSFYRDGHNCEECAGRRFYRAVQHRCIQDSRLKSLVCALEGYYHRWLGTYLENVNQFIALSRFSQKKFIEYGLPEKKVFSLPNCLDVWDYIPDYKKKGYVLFAGRLNQRYGVFALLEAASQLPQIEIRIAGTGEEEEKARKFVEEKQLKNVRFVGQLAPLQLRQSMSESYFMVFPSTVYHNCPMVILESFALGKPVIATNLGSVPELVRNNSTGLLFETRSVRDLVDKLKRLYQDPHKVREYGKNARKLVEEKYSTEKYYPRLLGLYQKLLDRSRYDN